MSNFEKAKPNIEIAYKNSKQFIIPQGFNIFNQVLKDVYEN